MLAIILMVLFAGLVVILIYVPWQQSISGAGKVIIFSPMHRPQNIEAQIPARLHKWHVLDGQSVKEGQLIVELSDMDSKFLDPEQVKKLNSQKNALSGRRAAAQTRYKALETQISSMKRSQGAALPSATERSKQTSDRIWAAEQALEAARQQAVTTELNLGRIKGLFEKGLRSKRDFELAELDHARALAEKQRADAAIEIAKRDRTLAVLDQEKVGADTDAAMNGVSAAMASAQETIETTTSEIFKLEIEIKNAQNRFQQGIVKAPCAGRIVRLLKVGAGSTVDAGEVLAMIAPETEDLAAELTVSDNDAPLIAVGRPVRLQFAGWPALQFAGWPSVAVGTFGGRVAVIDACDDGQSNYRVIVRPDNEARQGRDEPWPSSKFLRPGAEVTGWIMLDTVPVGFELWRQFNAFPPTVKLEELGLSKPSPDIGKSEKKRKSK
ncbi:MAG: biotin/lipoyl-binding protein [Candidatus Melainabacteria bacterium]|nr:biotin/lipoyl-binding protein [Candidatus Melainabacteria bacterium]